MYTKMAVTALIASAAVLAPFFSAHAEQEKGTRLEAAFKKADGDGDGKLTRDEARSMRRVAKNFDAIDADKDGSVTLDEIRTGMMHKRKMRDGEMHGGEQMHDRGVQRFKSADKDGSGTLTRDEAKSMPRVAKNFDAIDADKDGTVSETEIHDFMKARHDKHHMR
jgi:Ca2+-binding EF-hand superfamily protein